MCFEDFEKMLIDELKQMLPEKIEILPDVLRKNNNVMFRTLVLKREGGNLNPSVRIDDLYEEFRKGVPITHIATMVVNDYRSAVNVRNVPKDFFRNYNEVKKHLFCRLISREKNKELLADIPFQIWEDLAITCYYDVDPAIAGESTIQITNDHLRRWKTDDKELFRDAWNNTLRLQKAELRKLAAVLAEMCGDEQEEEDPDAPLYILSNRKRYFGAVCIAYPGEIEKIAEKLHSDFIMIPSSIHECLILPDDGQYNMDELNKIVREVNRTQLDEGEVLADHVYVFHEKTNPLEIPAESARETAPYLSSGAAVQISPAGMLV